MIKFKKILLCTVGVLILINFSIISERIIIMQSTVEAAISEEGGGMSCSHKYSWVTTKKATCTTSGSMDWKCSLCGYVSRTNSIAASGHNYADATCTTPKKCSNCNVTLGSALGHIDNNNDCKCDRCSLDLGHSYDTNNPYYKNDNNYHTKMVKCFVCSREQEIYKGKHTDGDSNLKCDTCGYALPCTHSGGTPTYSNGTSSGHTITTRCTKCNNVLSSKIENHAWPTTYTIDSTHHSKTCTKCGYGSKASHTFDTSNQCTVCKYMKQCSHNYSEATCTAPRKCTICGATSGNALGHIYSWVTSKEPTCTGTGLKMKICSRCSAKDGNQIIPANGHNYSEATCTSPRTCKICKITSGSALGHSYSEATCTSPRTCKICKATSGSALGHRYSEATCIKPKTCTICGATEGSVLKHDFAEATCTEPKTCTRCGATTGSVLWHNYSVATCTTASKCSRCGVTNGKELGHNYKYISIDAEYHKKVCTRCNDSTQNKHVMSDNKCIECNYVKPNENVCGSGHLYQWQTVKEPTCTETGLKMKICSRCSVKDGNQIIPATGHNYSEATYTSPKKCKICGVTEGSALKHDFADATCTSPKKCKICGVTEGSALKHDFADATCTEPKTCKICGATTGSVLWHNYSVATCTTAAKCSRCGETNGKELGHNYKYISINSEYHKKVCTRCNDSTQNKHVMSNNTCTECGYTEAEEKCEQGKPLSGHTLDTTLAITYEIQSTKHIKTTKCMTCRVAIERKEEAHKFSERKDCTSIPKCECGRMESQNIGHNLVATRLDDKQHSVKCKICDYNAANELHVYSNGKCLACNSDEVSDKQKLKPCTDAGENWVITYEKMSDERFHLFVITCQKCGKLIREKEEHIFKNGKCTQKGCEIEFDFSIEMEKDSKGNMSLQPGESKKITVKHNAGNQNVKFMFESSNPSVATVDSNGNVKANSGLTDGGQATITITSDYGKKKTINVEVEKIITIEMNIAGNSIGYISEDMVFTSIIKADKENVNIAEIESQVSWQISAGNAKLLQNKGAKITLKPNAVGNVTLTATVQVNNKGYAASITIKVDEYVVKEAKEKTTIKIGDSIRLGNVGSLTRISGESAELIGNVIRGTTVGVSVFKDSNGKTYEISVVDKIINIEAIDIKLSKNLVFVGETSQLEIIVTPENAIETYEISTTSGLSINNNTVTVTKEGKHEIYAKSESGLVTAKLEVNAKNEELVLNNTSVKLGMSSKSSKVPVDTTKLSEITLKTLKYSSSNPSIVDVTAEGIIVPKGYGETKIVVTADLMRGGNGSLVKETKSVEYAVKIIDGSTYSKEAENVYVKQGVGDSKEVLIYFPGTGGKGNQNNGLKTSNELYYTNNDKEYNNDIFTCNHGGENTDAASKAKIAANVETELLNYYGVTKEEFIAQGYSISVAGFSAGGPLAAEVAYILYSEGYTIDTLGLLDARFSDLNEGHVAELMNGSSETNLYTLYSDPNAKNNIAVRSSNATKAVGETYSNEQYAGRVTMQEYNKINHDGLVPAAGENLDQLAGGVAQ